MRLKILILLFIPIGLFGQANLKLVRTNDSTFTITNQETPEDTLWKFSADYLIRYVGNVPTDTLGTGSGSGSNIFDYISVSDSIGLGGVYIDGFDDSENLVIDSITTNNFSLNGSDYLDTIYSLADIGTSIEDAVEGSEFDNITTDSATVGYAITDSITTGLLRSSGYVIAGNAVHLFHYFGDSTISLSYTTSWQQLTNAWGEMWIYDEDDGFTVSGDTITITESGDYDFYCKNACSVDLNETFSIRFYNVTKALGVPVAGAVTGEGSGDYQSLPTSGYQEIDAGDKMVMQYKGDASGTAVFKSGVVKIYKIHE